MNFGPPADSSTINSVSEWQEVIRKKTGMRGRWSPGGIGIIMKDDQIGNEVNAITTQEKGWERIRVQVDSGAIDHVMPKDVAKGFEIRPTVASSKGLGYSASNGTRIRNHGEKRLVGRTERRADQHGDAVR